MRLHRRAVMVYVAISTLLFFAGGPPHSRAREKTTITTPQKEPEKDLVYADFGAMKNERPASARGGFIQIFAFQEGQKAPAKFKGLAGVEPPAPELVRLNKDETNVAATFEYELFAPNQYAGVGMIIFGLPDQDGTPVSEDVSGYSYLTLQASLTGVSSLTVEFLSQGQGINISAGSPQASIQVTPTLSVYKIPLAAVAQPVWAPVKVGTKDVLQKLTAINFIVGCGPCTPAKGRVALDNIVFHH